MRVGRVTVRLVKQVITVTTLIRQMVVLPPWIRAMSVHKASTALLVQSIQIPILATSDTTVLQLPWNPLTSAQLARQLTTALRRVWLLQMLVVLLSHTSAKMDTFAVKDQQLRKVQKSAQLISIVKLASPTTVILEPIRSLVD